MNINLFKGADGIWHADCTDLPGSPPCGAGHSPYEAIGSLFSCLYSEREIWGKYVDIPTITASKHPRGNDKVPFPGKMILQDWAEKHLDN